jgi:hypothetical protein
MRTLVAILFVLLVSAPSLAQTPTAVDFLVLPAAGDANAVSPVAGSGAPISATAAQCNLVPSTSPVATSNPGAWEFDDPFGRAGRVCRFQFPTNVPAGTGYRSAVVFTYPSCNPDGKQEIKPCLSVRGLGTTPPFSIVTPVPRGPAPTGLRLIE